MTTKQQGRAQSKDRQKPGSTGEGKYYHVEVRPKSQFVTYRTQDVGDPGHIQRVAGKRQTGSWETVKWLISKEDAHINGDRLVGDTQDVRDLLESLGSPPVLQGGDRFKASDRPNIPDKDKPTPAQTLARSRNIKKAQAAQKNKR